MTEKVLQLNTEKNIVWVLFCVALFLCGFYMYAVQQTVFNVVERGRIEESLGALNSRVGELEFTYIHLKNNIDLAYAERLGFVDTGDTSFVSRKPANSLSLNTTR